MRRFAHSWVLVFSLSIVPAARAQEMVLPPLPPPTSASAMIANASEPIALAQDVDVPQLPTPTVAAAMIADVAEPTEVLVGGSSEIAPPFPSLAVASEMIADAAERIEVFPVNSDLPQLPLPTEASEVIADAAEPIAVTQNENARYLSARSMAEAIVEAAAQTSLAGHMPPIGDLQQPRPPALMPLYGTYALMHVLDYASTRSALGSKTGIEANPLIAPVASHGAALLAMKAGAAGVVIWGTEKLWKKNPVGAIAFMAAANGAMAIVVAHNYSVAGTVRR